MKYIDTGISGVKIIEPEVYTDSRGYFMETFRQHDFERHVGKIDFVQENESHSTYGVIRGLHFQRMPYAQSKLVRCTLGRVLDIAVDIRLDSPTFGQNISVELSAENRRQLFLPRGMAHGFAVLSEEATFVYKCDAYYNPASEAGINPFDPKLAIDWPIDRDKAILSDKDTSRPDLTDIMELINFNGNLYDQV